MRFLALNNILVQESLQAFYRDLAAFFHFTQQEKFVRASQWVCHFDGLVTVSSWKCAVYTGLPRVENTINVKCDTIAVHRRN